MNFNYENQGVNTYLVYEIAENEELDTMSLGMLTNNKIPGLAPTLFTQMDASRYIKYNVSAKISVSQLFNGPVNKKRLIGVFSGIIDALLSAEDYMIDPQCILLDLDYIFADVSTCETVLVCLPVFKSESTNIDLGMFFKNIIFRIQSDQTENCDHIAKIINFLNSSPVLSLPEFKEVLDHIDQANGTTPVSPVKPPVPPVQPPVPPVQPPVPPVQPLVPPVQPPVPPVTPGKTPGSEVSGVYPPAPQVDDSEKPMSMFYLLQHYNKENAAKYKAQKDAKKSPKGADKQPATPAPAKKNKEKKAKTGGPSFDIPGQVPHPPVGGGIPVPGKQPTVTPVPTPTPVVKTLPVYTPPVQEMPPVTPGPVYTPPVSGGTPLNFGETTVLGGGKVGETTVLDGGVQPVRNDPHLIRIKNNERIPLNKPVFRIGKEKSYVDYFIGDNTAVSRSHANIVNHNGEFYIVDTNSTNHTYVNGVMIQSNVETKMSHGTKVRLANEDFEFKMY